MWNEKANAGKPHCSAMRRLGGKPSTRPAGKIGRPAADVTLIRFSESCELGRAVSVFGEAEPSSSPPLRSHARMTEMPGIRGGGYARTAAHDSHMPGCRHRLLTTAILAFLFWQWGHFALDQARAPCMSATVQLVASL